jgi:NAD(P)-dependent dehydrogenase (short-subunit alcohol dehydrogenase family)
VSGAAASVVSFAHFSVCLFLAVHPLESFMKVLAVNLGGTFNVARLAANQMQNQQARVVVCVLSVCFLSCDGSLIRATGSGE